MVMMASDAVSASVRKRFSFSRSAATRRERDRVKATTADAPIVPAMARNHQRRHTGGRISKVTAAGEGLSVPSVVTARTRNRYAPGDRLAKSTLRRAAGALQSADAPSSLYW